MKYLKTKKIKKLNELEKSKLKIIKIKAKYFLLIERSSITFEIFIRKQIIFRERNESLTLCFHSNQIKKALNFLHDVHNHFATNITMHRVIERFY